MAEISKVYEGISFTDSVENYLTLKNVSICQFLFFIDIADIAQYIEHHFYSDKDWHFRYDVEAMIKLTVVKFLRQQPYRKVVLSEEEALLPGFKEKDGIIQIPSGGTLHHFVKYRLGVKDVDKIMEMVGEKIIKFASSKEAKLDSTPLDASRTRVTVRSGRTTTQLQPSIFLTESN